MPPTAKPTIRIGTRDRNEKYVIAPANWLPSRSPYLVIAAIRCLTLLFDAMRLPLSTSRPMRVGFSVGSGAFLPAAPFSRAAGLESAMGTSCVGPRVHVRNLSFAHRPDRPCPTQNAGNASTAQQADLVVHRGHCGIGDLTRPNCSGRQYFVQFPGIGEVNRDLSLQRRHEVGPHL